MTKSELKFELKSEIGQHLSPKNCAVGFLWPCGTKVVTGQFSVKLMKFELKNAKSGNGAKMVDIYFR